MAAFSSNTVSPRLSNPPRGPQLELFQITIFGSFALLFSSLITRFIARNASHLHLLDKPNHRSGHTEVTPKGGGIAFALIFLFTTGCMTFSGLLDFNVAKPILFGAPIVLVLGLIDDIKALSALNRLCVHFLVAACALYLVTNGFRETLFISFLPEIKWLNNFFLILFIAWYINLFNFMDGSDGLVGGVSIVGSLLMAVTVLFWGAPTVALLYLLLAYCVAGFLPYNWAPAKIFMGDSGAYFLGFVFAMLALICKKEADVSFYSNIIIFGPLISDATYTLLVRAWRRARLDQAHRQHGFQKAIDGGWTEPKIVTIYTSTMIVWLFPLAHLACLYDIRGLILVIISYLPLILFFKHFRAGC